MKQRNLRGLWDVRLYGIKAGREVKYDMLAEAEGQQQAEALVIRYYLDQMVYPLAVSSELVAREEVSA